MMKWIALTEQELELVQIQMKMNEESLDDLLQYPEQSTNEQNHEYYDELIVTHDVLTKLETA